MRRVNARIVGRKAVFVVALAMTSCGGAPDLRPDVMVIVLDTFRADHLGVLGAGPGHTPVLDRLAGEGALFERCYAQAPLTLPSVSSLVASQWPQVHRVRDNYDERLSDRALTVSEVFRDAGYRTGAFVSALPLRAETGVAQGFDVYDDDFSEPFPFYREAFASLSEKWTGSERRGDNTVKRAIRWLESGDSKPRFLFVHLFDPHSPYDAPEPYASAQDTPYEGEIAFTDALVGELVDAITERAARSARAVPVVTIVSDHGEGLGEHEEWAHGFFLYDATIHVPWIVWAPDRVPPTRVSAPTRVIDVAPTLLGVLDGADLTAPAGWAGIDVLGEPTGSRIVYSETWFPREEYGWSELEAVVSAGWKWVNAPRPELYDLATDPKEEVDVIDAHPDRASSLAAQRDSLHAATIATARALDMDGLVEALTPESRVQEWLSNLGYIGGGGDDGSGPRPDPKDMVPEWNRQRDARAHAARAEVFLESGQTDLARQAFAAALAFARTPEVLAGYARTLLTLGRDAEAAAAASEALTESPNDVSALLVAGAVAQRDGRWEEAHDHLLRATLVDSTSLAAWRLRATGERARGAFAEAARSLEYVVRLAPTAVNDRRALAALYARLDRPADAARQYREVLARTNVPDPIDLWRKGRAELDAGEPELARREWKLARSLLRRGALRDSIDRALDSLGSGR